jgi:hypothetical protein
MPGAALRWRRGRAAGSSLPLHGALDLGTIDRICEVIRRHLA